MKHKKIISLNGNKTDENTHIVLTKLFDYDENSSSTAYSDGERKVSFVVEDTENTVVGALCKLRSNAILNGKNHYSFDFFEEALILNEVDIELTVETVLRMAMAANEIESPIYILASIFNDDGDHISDSLSVINSFDAEITECDSLHVVNSVRSQLAA